MPQTTDIILNGAGYMLQPGTYKRLQDGMAEGRTERVSITDFFGGQCRALQLERDKFATSLCIGPALDGQGVRPWAHSTVVPAASITGTFPDMNKPAPYVIVKDFLYVAIGPTVYKGPNTTVGGGYNWIVYRTYPNPIVGMCIYSSYGMLVTFGGASDTEFLNTNTGTSVVLLANERGHSIAAYAGHAAWSDARTASRPTIIRLAHGGGIEDRAIDHDPIAMTTVGAEMLVVSKQSLYTFTGRVKTVQQPGNPTGTIQEWSGEFTPYFQQGVYAERDDYVFIVGYGGRVVTWLANGVHEQRPSGDRAGWHYTGLSGRRCFGGCVAAGYVIACIESWDGQNQVWAYDGNGWWCIHTEAMSATPLCSPMPIGIAGNGRYNLVCMRHGSTQNRAFVLVEEAPTTYALAAVARFDTPLIDGGHRDKLKAWRKIGATFASDVILGNPASLDPINTIMDYSLDGGATWTVGTVPAGTRRDHGPTGNTWANNNYVHQANLSGAVSHFLKLRINWNSISDWAPVLTGVWAEYEVLESPARRRKWTFKIHARDQEVDRDGVLLTRTGRQLIEELWAAWQADTTLPFRDLDYDDEPIQRTVRIVGISESVDQPSDSNEWGDSIITLNLVEV